MFALRLTGGEPDEDCYLSDLVWLLARILILLGKQIQASKLPFDKPADNWMDVYWTLVTNESLFDEIQKKKWDLAAKTLNGFVCNQLCPFLGLTPTEMVDYVSSRSNSKLTMDEFLYLLICKEECNSFGLYTFNLKGPTHERQSYGLAIFPNVVYFNHQCSPNVGHVTRSVNNQVCNQFYAVKDIKKGEELCISYIPLHTEKVEERRQKLKFCFCFDCQCEKCIAQLSGKEGPRIHTCPQGGCHGWKVPTSVDSDTQPLTWYCEACRSTCSSP